MCPDQHKPSVAAKRDNFFTFLCALRGKKYPNIAVVLKGEVTADKCFPIRPKSLSSSQASCELDPYFILESRGRNKADQLI